MSGQRVLVTGASGFLGVAVCDAVREAGLEPLATDARTAPGVWVVDVCSPADLDAVLGGGEDVRAVVHLAAGGVADRGLVAGADADTGRAVRVNVEGFVHVVQAAARHGVPRVVWSSSTTVYGPARLYPREPVDESAPLHPTTAYGATKAACEHLGPVLAARLGLHVVSVRLPMVYGPGRWYGGSQQPLVELTDAIRDGSTVAVEAWSGPADWVHVEDAAAALVALIAVAEPRPAYHVVGHRGSLAELAGELVQAAAGDRATVSLTSGGAPDLPATDDTALRRDTGFRPRYPSAAAGAATYLPSARPHSTGGRP